MTGEHAGEAGDGDDKWAREGQWESAARCGERAVGGGRLTRGPAWSGKRRARAVLLSEAGQAGARARGVRVLGCCTLRAERGSWGAGWAG